MSVVRGVLLAVLLGLVVLFASACPAAENTENAPQNEDQQSDPEADAPSEEEPAAEPPTIDLVACTLVPIAKVLEITGGTPAAEPTAAGPTCMYVIEVGSGENADTESYHLFYGPAEASRALKEVQSEEEKGTLIEGPWDQAYLGKHSLSEQADVIAFFGDNLSVEVSGDREEAVTEIAKLAVTAAGVE